MVSPLLAAAISARSEPAPLSRLFVTVSVLGTTRPSRASSRGRNVALARRLVRGFALGFRSQDEKNMFGSFGVWFVATLAVRSQCPVCASSAPQILAILVQSVR